tara:strand:- start:614 stop:736 length:123 start_codon:yes stop_codon:yes gene_type:complete
MEEWIKLRLELINLFLDEEDKIRRNTIILQLKQIIEKYEN